MAAESFWNDPDAWPPRATRCPHCHHVMTPCPPPVRLHDRCCEIVCPRCGGRHARVAGDPRPLFCPDRPAADCFTALTVGVGPLWPPFDPQHDYLSYPVPEKESRSD